MSFHPSFPHSGLNQKPRWFLSGIYFSPLKAGLHLRKIMAEESGKSSFLSSWNSLLPCTLPAYSLVLDAMLSTQGAGGNASAHGFRAALRNETDSWCFSHEDPEGLSSVCFSSSPLANQASLSFTISRSLFKFMPIESVMPSNHLVLCCPLLLLPSIFPGIRVFSSESILCIRVAKGLELQLQHQSF